MACTPEGSSEAQNSTQSEAVAPTIEASGSM